MAVPNCIEMGLRCPTPQARPMAMSSPCFCLPPQPKKQMSPTETQYRKAVLNCLTTMGQKCLTPQARSRVMSSCCLCFLQQLMKQMSPAVLQYRMVVPNSQVRAEVSNPAGEAHGDVQPLSWPIITAKSDEPSREAEPKEPSPADEVQMGTEPRPPLDQDKADTPGKSDGFQIRELPSTAAAPTFKTNAVGTGKPRGGLDVNSHSSTLNM
ncbi:hypothetical protein PR048_014261 [Dryococelus australis]|uniref:Uncharacterized protein n=1 Tax=Dryococelus australis TaxID=614101 RepID=A0ABQ9HDR1_9NEOP|nr:hypothetical protein PR048_014261 [Dryococelus australis]